MNKLKQNKAITLIALIITIIILLILAGIVLNMTIGNDGIISKAQGAVDMYKNAQEKEEIELARINNEMEKQINGGRNLADETPGTATAADIMEGKTAWVNGKKITGTAGLSYGTVVSGEGDIGSVEVGFIPSKICFILEAGVTMVYDSSISTTASYSFNNSGKHEVNLGIEEWESYPAHIISIGTTVTILATHGTAWHWFAIK